MRIPYVDDDELFDLLPPGTSINGASTPASPRAETTLGAYLLDRLYALGLRHLFGVPGDYVLGIYKLLESSQIQTVVTTREDGAGFAADAYARLTGIGCACVTYCVGGLNCMNAVACAYAERSPVVLLSGCPGREERMRNPLLHHMVRDFGTQREVYERITVAAVTLDDPLTARREIDRALAALHRYKRPIYIEVPRDMVHAVLPAAPALAADETPQTDRATLADALADSLALLERAARPVLLVGAEVHRFGVQDALVQIAERMNVPVASTLLGKSVIREDHPLALGVYGGLVGRDAVQRFVEESDCIVMLGTILTDVDLGPRTVAVLDEGRTIHASADRIAVRRHRYDHVGFAEFVRCLAAIPDLPTFPRRSLPEPAAAEDAEGDADVAEPGPHVEAGESAITLRGLFTHLDEVLDDSLIVLADVGESLFAGADLHVRERTEFLSPAYYTTMGFAVPAAVGAGFARPELRPLVLVGDGAFQMTGTELSTALRNGQAPIVILLNNHGYSTEREILDGPFNDVREWRYERICDLLGGGVGLRVQTHAEFVRALADARADTGQMYLLNVLLDPADRSPAMVRLARRLAARIA
jgi:indolepyruvate decarboxylase